MGGTRRRKFYPVRTGVGGTRSRSSYGGIFAFYELHCEIRRLFRSQELRSINDGGRQNFDAGDDDAHLCVLGKLHRFRQFGFAPPDDCFIRQNLHRIMFTTGSASVATLLTSVS